MAHEITSTDGLVLHKHRAWHGLGTIVQDAPTPADALKIAGLDWEVEQWALSATNGEDARVAVTSHVANIRTDTRSQLGIVGKDWKPFQNRDLADFCGSLAGDGEVVKCETAGSIRGGQKVWFLLKGETFTVRKRDNDAVTPYICVSNGFDGGTALRITPTTIRVVCSNTLHMVIPRYESGAITGGRSAAYVVHHTGNMDERIEEAKAALKGYQQRAEENRELIDHLAAKEVNSEAVNRFLLQCYTKHFGAIADNPKNEPEQRKRDAALEAVAACIRRFEGETKVAGTTAWNALNAYTGWLQHDKRVNRKDVEAAREMRIGSNLLGENADRSLDAFATALIYLAC